MARFQKPNFGAAVGALGSAGQINAQSLQLLQRGIENLGRGIQSIGQGIGESKIRRRDEAARSRQMDQRDRALSESERSRKVQETMGLVGLDLRMREQQASQLAALDHKAEGLQLAVSANPDLSDDQFAQYQQAFQAIQGERENLLSGIGRLDAGIKSKTSFLRGQQAQGQRPAQQAGKT